jgi:hypothetical protein
MPKKGQRNERKHNPPKKKGEPKGEKIKFTSEVNRRLMQSKRITSVLLIIPGEGRLSRKATDMILDRLRGLQRFTTAVAGENENPLHYSITLQLDHSGEISLYETPKPGRKK